jgi:hypothetical protein
MNSSKRRRYSGISEGHLPTILKQAVEKKLKLGLLYDD